MPTYRYSCQLCRGGFEQWQSIHDNALTVHPGCGGPVIRVITAVMTYGVGKRGAVTVASDAREREIDKNRPAYKRLRDEGHQPVSLMGSDSSSRHIPSAYEIETRAQNEWEIKTGGLVSVPDDRQVEINEMMADAATGEWNPVEQVHRNRAKKGA